MSSCDMIVIGSCNTDLISYVPRMPSPGETVVGERFEVGFGGKGANQCVMASKLGAKVGMVAKLGNDLFGHQTIANFKSHQVDTGLVFVAEGVSSGVAPITVTPEGENAIVIVPGANNLLTTGEVDQGFEVIKKSRLMVCQLEIPPSVTLHALMLAREHQLITVFNTAPAAHISDEFYPLTDYLCMNESECLLLSGISPDTPEQCKQAVAHFLQLGAGCVILTLGEKGVVCACAQDPDRMLSVPAPSVKVVDTTGAGDAFVGALAFYLACKTDLSLEEKLRRSAHIASLSVTRPGTQKSYFSRQELDSTLFS